MDRVLYIVSFVAAILLIVGSRLVPDSAPMWLASTDLSMNLLRGMLAGMMLGLLFTEPPRRLLFRGALGALGILLAIMATVPLLQGSIHIVDVLLFAQASVCFLLAAIEAEPLPSERRIVERLPVLNLGGGWLTRISSGAVSAWLIARAVAEPFGTSKQHLLHPSTRTWHSSPATFMSGPPP